MITKEQFARNADFDEIFAVFDSLRYRINENRDPDMKKNQVVILDRELKVAIDDLKSTYADDPLGEMNEGMIITKPEAQAFVKAYSLMQDYIGCVDEIAESSPVGFTNEAQKMQEKLQSLYASSSFTSFKAKMEKYAGNDITFKSRP